MQRMRNVTRTGAHELFQPRSQALSSHGREMKEPGNEVAVIPV